SPLPDTPGILRYTRSDTGESLTINYDPHTNETIFPRFHPPQNSPFTCGMIGDFSGEAVFPPVAGTDPPRSGWGVALLPNSGTSVPVWHGRVIPPPVDFDLSFASS
ncbi:MAG: hypothetical protein D6820_15840, partial [Lentisphaerae bacterium]